MQLFAEQFKTDRFKEGLCDYCSSDLVKENWCSEWCDHNERHYKGVSCPHCGKKNWVEVDFIGSGHDPILQKELSPLESAVRKVSEK